MSHIHLPDGVLPAWLWIAGYIVIGLYLLFFLLFYKKPAVHRKFPLIGILAALMLIAMSIEIMPIAYHINLAVLTGIILGPFLSVLAILVSNIILAFLGHGGITVIGLNTISVSIEAILGFLGYKFFSRKIKNTFISVFLAAFIALFVSSWSTIGIVYLGTDNLEVMAHEHEQEHIHSSSSNQIPSDNESFDIKKFILLILAFGSIGWTIESTVTAFIVNYIKQIKPDIIDYK